MPMSRPAEASGYSCFGIPVASTLAFPGAWRAEAPAEDATVVVIDELPPWGETIPGGWEGMVDGERFGVDVGLHGEHRFTHGGRELFHLTADHRVLRATPKYPHDIRWWRLLLDSVLFTVSLLRGRQALHAGAVVVGSGAVAIVGRSGAGKSTLLGRLCEQGHELVTDDVLALVAADGAVCACPGPPVMTLTTARAARFGTPVGRVDDEVWTAVPVTPLVLPLRRVVLLDRRARAPGADLQLVTSPLPLLLKHLLRYPRTPEHERARFALAADVAAGTELTRLVADFDAPSSHLAALAVRGLED